MSMCHHPDIELCCCELQWRTGYTLGSYRQQCYWKCSLYHVVLTMICSGVDHKRQLKWFNNLGFHYNSLNKKFKIYEKHNEICFQNHYSMNYHDIRYFLRFYLQSTFAYFNKFSRTETFDLFTQKIVVFWDLDQTFKNE